MDKKKNLRSTLEIFLKFKACKSEKIDANGMDCQTVHKKVILAQPLLCPSCRNVFYITILINCFVFNRYLKQVSKKVQDQEQEFVIRTRPKVKLRKLTRNLVLQLNLRLK